MLETKAMKMPSSKHNTVTENISSKELYVLALDIHWWGQPQSQLWMGKGLTEPPTPLILNYWQRTDSGRKRALHSLVHPLKILSGSNE